MRAGRVVQQGTVDDVWRAPADAEAARFLGYATVLTGAAAHRVQQAAGVDGPGDQLALRRSALRVAPDGPLTGRVLAARTTPELVRLRLDVEGVGEVDAVADLPLAGGTVPGVGTAVPLVVDLTRAAPVLDSEVSGGWS